MNQGSCLHTHRFIHLCETNQIPAAKKFYIRHCTHINSAFCYVCFFGHVEMAKWLLQTDPTIDVCAENHFAFRFAFKYRYYDIVEWIQSLKPFLYEITYDAINGTLFDFNINTKKCAKWLQRRYPLWLASSSTPTKHCVFRKISPDVSRYIIQVFL